MKKASQLPNMDLLACNSLPSTAPIPEQAGEASRFKAENWIRRYGSLQGPTPSPAAPGLLLAPPASLQTHTMTAGQVKAAYWRSKLKASVQVRGCCGDTDNFNSVGIHHGQQVAAHDHHQAHHHHEQEEQDPTPMLMAEDEDEDEDELAPGVVPLPLIESIDELEDLAEELGATNSSLADVARSLFDGKPAHDAVVTDNEERVSEASDPWMAGWHTENKLIDHMLEMFSTQAPPDFKTGAASLRQEVFKMKNAYGE
jgi:hypothetical protein